MAAGGLWMALVVAAGAPAPVKLVLAVECRAGITTQECSALSSEYLKVLRTQPVVASVVTMPELEALARNCKSPPCPGAENAAADRIWRVTLGRLGSRRVLSATRFTPTDGMTEDADLVEVPGAFSDVIKALPAHISKMGKKLEQDAPAGQQAAAGRAAPPVGARVISQLDQNTLTYEVEVVEPYAKGGVNWETLVRTRALCATLDAVAEGAAEKAALRKGRACADDVTPVAHLLAAWKIQNKERWPDVALVRGHLSLGNVAFHQEARRNAQAQPFGLVVTEKQVGRAQYQLAGDGNVTQAVLTTMLTDMGGTVVAWPAAEGDATLVNERGEVDVDAIQKRFGAKGPRYVVLARSVWEQKEGRVLGDASKKVLGVSVELGLLDLTTRKVVTRRVMNGGLKCGAVDMAPAECRGFYRVNALAPALDHVLGRPTGR